MTTKSKGRVLVVDDEEAVRQSIAIVLSQSGFTPVLAASAHEAWSEHQRTPCDLLLVDKNMPGESGLDLVQRLRDDGDGVPVIVMTAFGSVESAIVGLHLCVFAYIEKPFDDIFALATLVERALIEQRERLSAGKAITHFRRAKAALAVAAARAGRGVRVLVSGPSLDREVLARAVLRGDDIVEHHPDNESAIEAAARLSPDLVMIDMGCPGMDVFAALERLHDVAAQAWCVVVADHPSLSDVVRLIGLDARAVLERPLDEPQIRDRLGPIAEQLRQKG